MLHQLHSGVQGARAELQGNYGRLGCTTSVHMLLRFFSVLVAPAISYECKGWGSQSQGKFDADAKKSQGVQFAFLRHACGRLPDDTSMPDIPNELVLEPWTLSWWVQHFALRVSDLPLVSNWRLRSPGHQVFSVLGSAGALCS